MTIELEGAGEERYHAALWTAEGEEVWSQTVSIARAGRSSRMIVLTIAAKVFQEGDYVLTLRRRDFDGRLSPAAQYSFSVAR